MTVAVLSSAVLSIIGTALITSLVWCCAVIKIKKLNAKHAEFTQQESTSTQLKENISIEENVAYGQVGNMSRL